MVIGGGIVGTSAAAFLAQTGLSVALIERDRIGAGASGRNSGAIQHPFDPFLAELHGSTLDLYRELAEADRGFALGDVPAGLILVSHDEQAVRMAASEIKSSAPQLHPAALMPAELARLEPQLGPDLAGCRLETGYPVAPEAATHAFARRARSAGASLRLGDEAALVVGAGRVTGVRLGSGERLSAGQVLVAAGPWTARLIDSWRAAPPIRPVWGVVVGVALEPQVGHVIEELGIEGPGATPEALFSLVTAGGSTSVGSTFLEQEPQPADWIAPILERAQRFVPALAQAAVVSHRSCARPVAVDGRPLIGAVPGVAGLFVCAGHGPWGISTGPAAAKRVSELMIGGVGLPDEFSPARAFTR